MTIIIRGLIFLFFNSLFLILHAQPKYEFRGVWVVTGYNIDWPSAKNLSAQKQKAEFITLLEMHRRNGINAVLVQIRPGTDAFYPSQYEPWSEWLTGVQGKPPYPFYDPLQFMITETHKRGMEFHAWMNPYRAEYSIGRYSIAATHVTKLHPEWFIAYGGKRYFDPGNKEVQQFVNNVVKDVVKRYDVDGIHFDDYFYPYPIPGKIFPDDNSYKKYGNGLSKDDWRRSNVDSIIALLGKTIKAEKAHCRFGISPFGVWRNNNKDAEGSNTSAGYNNYDDLYADILLWLKSKWIDYAAPQIYWERGHKLADFDTLVAWWANHNYNRQLYIGQGVYKVYENKPTKWKNKAELPAQIQKLRTYKEVQGSIFYSSNIFRLNPNGWNDTLQNNYYRYPALVPPMPWISPVIPAPPIIQTDASTRIFKDQIRIYISKPQHDMVNKYVIYRFTDPVFENKEDAKNIVSIISAEQPFFVLPLSDISYQHQLLRIAVTSVSKTNNESSLSNLIILKKHNEEWIVQ